MNTVEYTAEPDRENNTVMLGKFDKRTGELVGKPELLSREEADDLARQLVEAVKTMGTGDLTAL